MLFLTMLIFKTAMLYNLIKETVNMIYSNFHDLKLSRLGFGCMRFKMVDGEVDQETVNAMFDLAMRLLLPYGDIRVTAIIWLTSSRDIPCRDQSITSPYSIFHCRDVRLNTLISICSITSLNGR